MIFGMIGVQQQQVVAGGKQSFSSQLVSAPANHHMRRIYMYMSFVFQTIFIPSPGSEGFLSEIFGSTW